MNFNFYLRESVSDVSPAFFMSDIPGSPIEMDFTLGPSGAGVGAVWISPAAMPNLLVWPAGQYAVQLQVVAANSIQAQIALYRMDTTGQDELDFIGLSVYQIASGASPSAPVVLTFTFDDPGSSFNQTDRLVAALLIANTDSVNANTFSIMSSQSMVSTPIEKQAQWSLREDFRHRGKFLGKFRRAGEGSPEGAFDKNGVDLPC